MLRGEATELVEAVVDAGAFEARDAVTAPVADFPVVVPEFVMIPELELEGFVVRDT